MRDKLVERRYKMSRYTLCPRCGRDTMHPRNLYNALSRTDNSTYICNECGISEALESTFFGGCTLQKEWPILNVSEVAT